MKGIIIAALLATLGGSARADDISAQNLTARELHVYLTPYVSAIRDCYAANSASGDGTLRLNLVIQRDGFVERFTFEAPGVARQALRALDACLRPLSETWHFPVRRSVTSAVVPYAFVRTPRR
jgi:hypothetical protein